MYYMINWICLEVVHLHQSLKLVEKEMKKYLQQKHILNNFMKNIHIKKDYLYIYLNNYRLVNGL